jgi:hypothetical protein
MALSQAMTSEGTLFKRSGTEIAEVISIDGPGLKRDKIDKTHLTSPSGYREFFMGLAEGGDVKIGVSFLPDTSGHQLFLTDFNAKTKSTYSITWPGADDGSPTPATWSFNAYVQAIDPKTETGSKVDATITFAIDGPVST